VIFIFIVGDGYFFVIIVELILGKKLDILSELASGQLARLIPSTSDTNKEKKATSVVLASFMACTRVYC
jgi:hypothetical protein